MQIGRNQLCPCGSGQKYKRCCGNPLKETANVSQSPYPRSIPPEVFAMIERHKAAELIREQQQGLGRPIISMKVADQQIVGAGDTIYYSSQWKTMPDFLSDYIKMILDGEWGNAEIKKPLADRHPILQWYHEYCLFQQKWLGNSGEIKSAPMTGVAYCYLGLAYGLYLLKHNVELQKRLINRLKDPKQFQGAYYEVIVANNLIRAGFDLALEDEADETTKHCEFSAISKKTGKKYWVEAKMRSVAGVLAKTKLDGTTDADPTCKLTDHVGGALKKPAQDDRMIFVDVNADPSEPGIIPSWTTKAGKRLDAKERDLKANQSAYVFVTNMPFHRVLQSDMPGHVMMAFGLGISDFSKPGTFRLSEIHRQRKKHADAYEIVEAFKKYPQLPPTLDGSLPSSISGKPYDRIIMGETYLFEGVGEGGLLGMVTSAIVNESEKTIYLAVTTREGVSHVITQPISDEALHDYKAHPEAFFGVIQHVGKKTEDPYELFLFFLNSYQNTPKEKILEFMNGAEDMAKLQEMSQEDLAIEYAERLAGTVINSTPPKN